MAQCEHFSQWQVHWIFKNKDHGKISATASIGLITLWDIEGGLPQIDKYQYSKDPYVVGGAALAVGLTCTRVSHENDPAFALLFDACESKDPVVQLPAIMGMGLAYADSNKVCTYCDYPSSTPPPPYMHSSLSAVSNLGHESGLRRLQESGLPPSVLIPLPSPVDPFPLNLSSSCCFQRMRVA